MLLDVVDKIAYILRRAHIHEHRLHRCQGYRPDSIIRWKQQTGLGWSTTIKLLNKLEIFDSTKIRQVIHNIMQANEEVFSRENLFIVAFGSEGKSGGVISYEFHHSELVKEELFKSSADIVKFPSGSTVVFVDDLIGTGTQSLEHITDKLNLLLSPSHNAFLLTICATPEGKQRVEENSNFIVLTGVELTETEYQHYSPNCTYFTEREKEKLIAANSKLKLPTRFDYDRGLLIAFYYAVPNNCMPIIWKDGFRYEDINGGQSEWFALLPRRNPAVN